MKFIPYYFLLLFCGVSFAQLSIDNVTKNPDGTFSGTKFLYTPSELAKTVLVIPNPLYYPTASQTVFPFNIIYNKSLPDQGRAIIYNDQAGKWETKLNAGNLGLGSKEYGVLLTTGKTEVAFGPNNTGSATDVSILPPPVQGDLDLQKLAGAGNLVQNISVLEFDFIALGYSVSFDYVFGSEEYPKWIDSAFNDAFGFFLSGFGIAGGKGYTNDAVNLAVLPVSDTGNFNVTIGNVNHVRNMDYYVSNGKGNINPVPSANIYTQYNGFTKLLSARYSGLICGQTYHIKLAIGNVTDNTLDSGVFLKNFAVAPPELSVNGVTNAPTVCGGDPAPIKAEGDFPADAIYAWTKDGVPLAETGNSLLPTTSGQYCVTITRAAPSNCPIGTDCIDILILPDLDIVPPVNMSKCAASLPPYTPPFYFNIDQTALMLSQVNPIDYAVTYYNSSFQDAFEGVLNGEIANSDLSNYPLTTASQTIWVRVKALTGALCVNVASFQLEAILNPNPPTGSTTFQPTCATPTGIIKVTSPIGAMYEYSKDGGTNFQTNPVFSGLSPNTSYSIIAKNVNSGCISKPSNPIIVNSIIDAPQNITLDITQPTCPVQLGTINFTSPIGVNYEYSINGGTNYQASTNFSNLSINTYNTLVKDIITGCVSSPVSYSINPLPANPVAPTLMTTQPTCTNPSGSITITAPLGVDLEYSNGGIYQSSPDFVNLSPNTSYNFTVRNKITQCVSSFTTALINPTVNAPNTPTANVIFQPTCAIPTGTIEVSSPLGVIYEYSIDDGTNYQAGIKFSGLPPNKSYNIIVKNTNTNCVSIPSSAILVKEITDLPQNIKVLIEQPTCQTPSGTIAFTSPLGTNYEYSINGGTSYQPSAIFRNLISNSYKATVKDVISGCESTPKSYTIDPLPLRPIIPKIEITQPDCSIPLGSATIIAPIGAEFEYSNGGAYQSSPDFVNLLPNTTYSFTVMDIVTGCISNVTSIFINASGIPDTPMATADNISPCETTSFTLSTPTIMGAKYFWTGPNEFSSSEQNPTIINATPNMSGNYKVVISFMADCPSLPGSVTVTVNPTPVPSLEDGFVCVDGVSQVVTSDYTLDSGLSASNYNFEWFEIVGGNPNLIPSQTSSTYVVNTPGTYGVRAENNATNCASGIVTATVVTASPPTSIEITASNYFAQYQSVTVNASPVGNYVYQIDNGYFQKSNVFNNVSAGEHKVVVKDSEGCAEITQFVNIIDYPKFFTPNGDGINDTWNIQSLSSQPNSKISIFDKYGRLLGQIRPSGKGWDGSFNGKNLPSTDYWFNVNYEEVGEEKIFRAHFTLKR